MGIILVEGNEGGVMIWDDTKKKSRSNIWLRISYFGFKYCHGGNITCDIRSEYEIIGVDLI